MKTEFYTSENVNFKGKKFSTKDGKYHTKSDSKGYSYWFDNEGIKLGNTSIDYVFACKDGLLRAVEILNKLKLKYSL